MSDSFTHLVEPLELGNLAGDLLLVDLLLRPAIPERAHSRRRACHSGGTHGRTPPSTGAIAGKQRLDALFSRIGLTDGKTVVVYDDEGGGWAGRMAWTLDVIGHQNWLYLNGGLRAWIADGLPLESAPVTAKASHCGVTIDQSPITEAEEIMASLKNPDFLVWDARSPAEYEGTRVVSQRGGHIPGAVNCEWTTLMDPSRALRIRADAREVLKSRGITPEKKISTHCQSHHRSAFTYLVARILGYPDIRAYHGSWSEWGNRMDTPVETGQG